MEFALGLVEFYISPFLVALGLAFFLDGLINYFIIGIIGGEEDRREVGRQSLVLATAFFLGAMLLFATLSWVAGVVERLRTETDAGVELQTGEDFLRIPNTPTIE